MRDERKRKGEMRKKKRLERLKEVMRDGRSDLLKMETVIERVKGGGAEEEDSLGVIVVAYVVNDEENNEASRREIEVYGVEGWSSDEGEDNSEGDDEIIAYRKNRGKKC